MHTKWQVLLWHWYWPIREAEDQISMALVVHQIASVTLTPVLANTRNWKSNKHGLSCTPNGKCYSDTGTGQYEKLKTKMASVTQTQHESYIFSIHTLTTSMIFVSAFTVMNTNTLIYKLIITSHSLLLWRHIWFFYSYIYATFTCLHSPGWWQKCLRQTARQAKSIRAASKA